MARKPEPLTTRLRQEAAEWSDTEPARQLLLEAADMLEQITAEIDRLLNRKTKELG